MSGGIWQSSYVNAVFFCSKEHLVRLHHKKEHDGHPFIAYKADRDSWDKLRKEVTGLPGCMPALPWNPASEGIDSDLDIEMETPSITVILNQMKSKRRISPIRMPPKRDSPSISRIVVTPKDNSNTDTSSNSPLDNINMTVTPRSFVINRETPVAYFTKQYREREEKKRRLNPPIVKYY